MGTSMPSIGGVNVGLEAHNQSSLGMEGGIEGLKPYTVSTAVNLYV